MEDLKRVGLIFKQEGAVDFKKSLQEVNIEMNKSYNQFKLTQAQWDKSTTSTQKLKAEQEHLKEVYEIQEDKVKILRMQLEELENAENKNTQAIKKKRNELTNAELKLKTYEQKIKDIDKELLTSGKRIQEWGKHIEESGKKIESTGKKFSAFSIASATALAECAKEAIEFESDFTGVEKTVDGTKEQMEALKIGIREMAKEIPSTTTEISAVAESAGQLGIATDDILSFTRVMIDLGNSTNLSAEEAASSLAKFANITKMNAEDYSRLGSVIVALGNNFATTEADIVSMATRLAATGELTGLSQAQIMALATAMSSVGIEADAGGSAMSKLLKKIQVACETGGKDLKAFAKVSNMSTKDFKKAFEEDAVGALRAFLSGLNDTERNGKSAIGVLEDMGLTEVRLSNTILSLSNASDVMNKAVAVGNEAWEDNTALTNEANKRYETLKSKIVITLNKVKDMAITLGNKLMPSIDKIVDKAGVWIEKFDKLNDEQLDTIINLGLLVVAISPVLTTLGKLTSGIGTVVKSYGKFREGLGLLISKADESGSAMTGLLKIISGLTSPLGIACLAIGAAITAIAVEAHKTNEKVKESFTNMGESASDFVSGINSAEGYLKDFNSTLFASNEEQQELQENMAEVQAGITEICKRASDERRGYTDEEITQLDEYFTKLRDLKNREIEIQSQIATAITQQATSNAESFQGSLEEYKVQAQEWIKTARDQKDATVKLIEEGTIQEISLLNQRYSTEEERQSDAYKKEYEEITKQRDEKIKLANEEVAKVSEIYTSGYASRADQDGDFYEHIKHYNWEQEQESSRHNDAIKKIEDAAYVDETQRKQDIARENVNHKDKMSKIWKDMYKNMSESEAEQLGVWLAMVSETKMYGGQIDDETQELVDSIVESFDSMPKGTREAMKNAMTPMLEEMEKKEPTLFAKAKSIGDGIISRLKKAFDEHSPSKKTRQIMKFAMQPMEEEMEKGEKELFKKSEDIAKGVTERLNDIDGNIGLKTDIGANNSNQPVIYLENSIDYDKMTESFVKAIKQIGIFIDKNTLVGSIAEPMNESLAQIQIREERGG